MSAIQMRAAAAALALLTALTLTGCGDDDPDQTTGNSADTESSSNAADADTETNAEDEDAEGEDAEGEDAVAVDDEIPAGEACLYGNWILDNESFKETMEQAGGTVRSVEGLVMISYQPGGKTISSYHDWKTLLVVPDADGDATMLRDGEDLGTYVVSGDTITMTETDAKSVLTMTMVVDGQTVTLTPPREPFLSSSATFTCDAELLTITAEGATSRLGREH